MKKSQMNDHKRIIDLSGFYLVIKGRKIHIWYFILTGLILHFIYHSSIITIENFRLSNNGKIIRAIVTDKRRIGGKGTIDLTFEYEVDGVIYSNTQINEPYNVGDSIYVVYQESNPEISRTFRFIKTNYNTDITIPK